MDLNSCIAATHMFSFFSFLSFFLNYQFHIIASCCQAMLQGQTHSQPPHWILGCSLLTASVARNQACQVKSDFYVNYRAEMRIGKGYSAGELELCL